LEFTSLRIVEMLKRALAIFITAGIFSGLISAPAHALINRDVRCSGGGFFRITQSVVEAKTSAENTVPANKCVGTAVIPVGVTEIGAQAFNGETLMTSIVLPDTITIIGGNGLASTGLTSVNLPANLTRLGQGALFDNGSLTSLVIPASVTQIEQYVLFNSANLCNVYFLGTQAPVAAPNAFASICSGGTAKGWVPNGASLYPLPGQDFGGLQINSGAAIILFDSNGATAGSIPATEVVIIGSTFTFPSKGSLDRTNSSFLGWCTTKLDEGNGNCYIPGNTLVAPEGTTIVYANWQGDPKVTYNGNGNTAGSAPVDSNSPYVKNSSVTVAGSAGSLEKTGYTFDGWNTQADLSFLQQRWRRTDVS
jgi:hypothetical protein